MKKTRNSLQASAGSMQTSFLPEPDFIVKFPKKHTLPWRLLDLLMQGNTISHPKFEKISGSWRAAAAVHILRKMGWPIESFESSYKTKNLDRQKSISNYFIPVDFIKSLREISGGIYG